MKKSVNKRRPKQKLMDDASPSSPYLPQELVLQNIVTRLPARILFRFRLVSKLWYNSISNDSGFALSHFAHHQNKTILSFNLFNVSKNENLLKQDEDENYLLDEDEVTELNEDEYRERNFLFSLQKKRRDNYLYDFKLLSESDPLGDLIEPVGNCYGLACVKRISTSAGFEEFFIINHVRRETLHVTCLTPEIGEGKGSVEYLCHGFGFDSLSKEYKVVLIYTTSTVDGDEGFICMVVTLGGSSWRRIVTSICDISPPPGHSPFPSKMVTTMWRDDHKYSTPCGNDLLWMVTNTGSDDGNKNQMLLSFDVHNEKMQFVRLPPEYNALISTLERDGSLEIAYHLLEFKGYPCLARSERVMKDKREHPGSNSKTFLSYDIEVNLCILEDKIKQIWIQQKTYNVSLKGGRVTSKNPFRNPFMRYFNQVSPPTRMFSFDDKVMLYWFDGGCLIFYNLEKKHHNVVQGIGSCDVRTHGIFKAKIIEIKQDPCIGEDIDDSECDCPCVDYLLHAQAENIISLKTFISKEGEVGEFGCFVTSNFNNL